MDPRRMVRPWAKVATVDEVNRMHSTASNDLTTGAVEVFYPASDSASEITEKAPLLTQLAWIVGALCISGLLIAGICILSPGGTVEGLSQRLFGSVTLSTGNFATRSVDELNLVSWDNGLAILESLDIINDGLDHWESLINSHGEPTQNLSVMERKILIAFGPLKKRLKDRRKLEESAQKLGIKDLYAPVYENRLKQTLKRYRLLRQLSNNTQAAAMSSLMTPSDTKASPSTSGDAQDDQPFRIE